MPVLRTCRQHGGMSDLSSSLNQTCHRPAAALFETGGIANKNRSPSAKHTTHLPPQNTHHMVGT